MTEPERRPVGLILDTSAITAYLTAPSVASMSVSEVMRWPAEDGEVTGLPVAALVQAATLGHGVAALAPLTEHPATVTLADDWPVIMTAYELTGDLGAAAAVAARHSHAEAGVRILTDQRGLYRAFPRKLTIAVDHRGLPPLPRE